MREKNYLKRVTVTILALFMGIASFLAILGVDIADTSWAGQGSYDELFQLVRQYSIDIKKLESILIGGVDPDAGELGNTPLCYSIAKEDKKASKLLIQYGARVTGISCSGVIGSHASPIEIAASKGMKDMVRLMVSHITKDRRSNVLKRTLCTAVSNGKKNVTKLLIKKGADINHKECNWKAPLDIAAERGHKDIAAVLLKFGASIQGSNKRTSPLCRASEKGHTDIVKLLVNYGANPNTSRCESLSRPPLMLAASGGHRDTVEFLLSEIAGKTKKQETIDIALFAASRKGHTNIVKLLISHGAAVNKKTSIVQAAVNGHKDVVQLLIFHGADVDVKDSYYGSAICGALLNGHKGIAELLIARGADILGRTCNGGTPLCVASAKGQREIAGMLIAQGADVNAFDCKFERSALMVASFFGEEELVSLLINAGGDIKLVNNRNETPLLIATYRGKKGVIEILLRHGASVNVQDKSGLTPLMKAAGYGRQDVVDLLLNEGANVNEQDNKGRTALMHAVQSGKSKTAISLIRKGGNKDVRNYKGETAYDIAVKKKNNIIATYLKTGELGWQQQEGYYDRNKDKRVVRSVWIDMDKPSGNLGIVDRIFKLISFRGLSELAGMDIFSSGPHVQDMLSIEHSDFGHYNKKFVIWMRENFIPGAKDESFRKATQYIYERYLKKIARTYYETYVALHAQPKKFSDVKEQYMKHIEQGKYFKLSRGLKGFWYRRAIDGTDKELFQGLERLLMAYDRDFLESMYEID